MTNRYVRINKVVEYDGDGGIFISNSVSHNQEIFFIFDEGQLSEISIFLTNRVFNIDITEEEKRYIEEQLQVKKWEVLPFSFRKIEHVMWDHYPIIKRVHFTITESEEILTAHYKDWKLHTVTAPYFNTYTQRKEHTILTLSDYTVTKLDKQIKLEMMEQHSKII
ncbi:hypothetical protein ACFSCX_15340 [Bacillus salitolerans]|uniref:Group-specific protein n=1 Tax=Bacillus salitolerans TaxID=1437434 RepID=A0ABW4LS07_9BACI